MGELTRWAGAIAVVCSTRKHSTGCEQAMAQILCAHPRAGSSVLILVSLSWWRYLPAMSSLQGLLAKEAEGSCDCSAGSLVPGEGRRATKR